MSIPTSLIVVLLVVAWLVVLVPMVAKRRDKVPRTQSGGQGFRVLRRAQASLRRRPKRTAEADTEQAAEPVAADVPGAPATGHERALVTVGAPADAQPQDAADEWASAHPGYRSADPRRVEFADDEDVAPAAGESWTAWPEPRPTAPDDEYDDEAPTAEHRFPVSGDQQGQDGLWADPRGPVADLDQGERAEPSVTEFPYARAPRIPNEIDEQEWDEHAAAASAPARRYEVDDDALRPTPRRRGRGGYDPEAAEATRAYKYRQRRRVTMALTAATVLFSVAALLLVSWLWVGAAISAVLLALYLTYLRRQVKIEAQIRQRRMERLQRARQIRPEYGRGRPPARAGRSAAGPGRTVVDLDDDDPTFDHLDPYDPPVTYRRAAGQ